MKEWYLKKKKKGMVLQFKLLSLAFKALLSSLWVYGLVQGEPVLFGLEVFSFSGFISTHLCLHSPSLVSVPGISRALSYFGDSSRFFCLEGSSGSSPPSLLHV